MPLKDRIVGRLYDAKRAMRARRLEKYKEECAGPMVSHRVVVDMSVGIGNAVEATPMVQALRSLWPRAHMTLVAPIGDMFSDWCIVDRAVGSWDDVADEAVEDVFLPWFAEAPDNVSGDVHRAMRAFPDYLLRPEREVNMDLARELGYRGDTPPLFVAMREPASPPPLGTPRRSRWL